VAPSLDAVDLALMIDAPAPKKDRRTAKALLKRPVKRAATRG
jgi:hypothetical protein